MSEPQTIDTLNPSPLIERIMSLAAEGRTGILEIRHPALSQSTKLAFDRGSVGGAISPVLRAWSNELVPFEVDAGNFERARVGAGNIAELFHHLETNGTLRPEATARVLRRRVINALLPVLDSPEADVRFSDQPVGPGFIRPGTRVFSFVAELRRRFHTMRTEFSPLRPDSSVIVKGMDDELDLDVPSLEFNELEVFSSFAAGLSPVEVAARTGHAWDTLCMIVTRLERLNMVRVVNLAAQPGTRIRKRLLPGDLAPNFSLPDADGRIVTLEHYRGRAVLIRFNRQAGCPFCNPRNRDFIRLYPEFQRAGVEILSIFGSPVDGLRAGIGKQNPPYPILADPKDTVYALYGVERSLRGILNPKNLPVAREGIKMETYVRKGEGEITRMPAEILVGPDGRVLRVHYQAFAADFLPLETLMEDWLGLREIVLDFE
jgi:peroxiredoxin